MFSRKLPAKLTPTQLQALLHDEKQESYYIYLLALTVGAIAAAVWPSFAPIYATYGGLLLAGLVALFGVNVAHKALNNKAAPVDEEEEEEELPRASS